MKTSTHRKKFYSFKDLTKENIARWNKTRWPQGIWSDLARKSEIKVKDDEKEIFKVNTKRFKWFVITRKYDVYRIWVGRYYFPNPAQVSDKQNIKYLRGTGFSIPASFAPYWRTGLKRLFNLPKDKLGEYNKRAVYSIRYGTRDEQGFRYQDVRFFVDIKHGVPYYQIQAFMPGGGPRKRLIFSPTENPLLLRTLDKALREVEADSKSQVTYADDCLCVTITNAPDEYDD